VGGVCGGVSGRGGEGRGGDVKQEGRRESKGSDAGGGGWWGGGGRWEGRQFK